MAGGEGVEVGVLTQGEVEVKDMARDGEGDAEVSGGLQGDIEVEDVAQEDTEVG